MNDSFFNGRSGRHRETAVNPSRMYGSADDNPSMLREGNLGLRSGSFDLEGGNFGTKAESFWQVRPQWAKAPRAAKLYAPHHRNRQETAMFYDDEDDAQDALEVGRLNIFGKAKQRIQDIKTKRGEADTGEKKTLGSRFKKAGARVKSTASSAVHDWKEQDLSPAVQVRVRAGKKIAVTNTGTGDKPVWQVEPLIGMLAAGSNMNVGALGVLTAAKAGIRGSKAAVAKVKEKKAAIKANPFATKIPAGGRVVVGYIQDGSVQSFGDARYDTWDSPDPGDDFNMYTGMEDDPDYEEVSEEEVGAIRRRPLLSALVPGSGLVRRLAARRRTRRGGVGELGDAEFDVWDSGYELGYVRDGSVQDYGDRFNDAFDTGMLLGSVTDPDPDAAVTVFNSHLRGYLFGVPMQTAIVKIPGGARSVSSLDLPQDEKADVVMWAHNVARGIASERSLDYSSSLRGGKLWVSFTLPGSSSKDGGGDAVGALRRRKRARAEEEDENDYIPGTTITQTEDDEFWANLPGGEDGIDANGNPYFVFGLPSYGDADMDVWDAEVEGVADTIRAAKLRNRKSLGQRIAMMSQRVAAQRAGAAGVGYLYDGADNLSGDAQNTILGALEDAAELVDTDGFRVPIFRNKC